MIVDISPITAKLPFGKNQLFSYTVPKELEDQIQIGSIVEMPLGTRIVKGVIFSVSDEGARKGTPLHLKPIKKIIQGVQLNQYQLDLAIWMHRFYHAPLGVVLKFVAPNIPKRYKIPSKMAGRQDTRYKKISNFPPNWRAGKFQISKKDPISNVKYQIISDQNERFKKYTELIKKYKKQKKRILFLLPQIIDVETLYSRMASLPPSGMGGNVGKIHSQLNMTEYYNNWAGFQSGEIDVLIGTRQAVLSPPSNLGLIIIDEYQDDDFKQLDQTPRFSAVEAAKKVCEMTGAELVLGASSPPLEGLPVHSNAEAGGVRDGSSIYYFGKNVCSHPPLIPPSGMGGEIIDSQNEYFGKNFSPLSNKLQELLIDAAKNKKWAFILINRRGDASFIICRDCGSVIKCPKCDAPLVLHKNNQRELLLCHHCGYKMAPPEKCLKCSSPKIKYSSPGTQGVEREITNVIASEKNIVRIDSDAIKTKKGMGDVLKKLRKESGIIIGTQAAAKIWMPAELGLIGAINIDSFLNRSDFRAAEKTFQIISELKSRLSKNGKMIIQTFNPESKTLSFAASGDFESFSKEELKIRRQFNYPPFCRIIKMTLLGRDTRKVLQKVDRMKKFVIANFKNIEIFGPIPSEIIKRGLFGKTLVLKISGWNEKMHLELMKNIGDEWSITPHP